MGRSKLDIAKKGGGFISQNLNLVLLPSHVGHLCTRGGSPYRESVQQLRYLNRIHSELLLPLRREKGYGEVVEEVLGGY